MLTLNQVMWRAVADPAEDCIVYQRWIVVRVTPRGGWCRREKPANLFDARLVGPEKWTSDDGGRYMSTTRPRALARLEARTKSYLKHARSNLRDAEYRARMLDVYTEPVDYGAVFTEGDGSYDEVAF